MPGGLYQKVWDVTKYDPWHADVDKVKSGTVAGKSTDEQTLDTRLDCEAFSQCPNIEYIDFRLQKAGIDVTLICDNMASSVMKQGKIQAVFVGCDRVAMNGDAANKIGTSGVAILAKHYGIPFYVCAPSSTIDEKLTDGSQIPIEERPGEEISTMW